MAFMVAKPQKISEDFDAVAGPPAKSIYVRVAVVYSFAHAAVICLNDIASSAVNDVALAADATALFFISYCLTGLLIAVPAVVQFGAKKAFLIGFGLSCLQTVLTLLFVQGKSLGDPHAGGRTVPGTYVFYFASMLGGIGYGMTLTAEGTYLSRCAAHLALQQRTSLVQQTTGLAALLAAVAMPTEATLLLFSSVRSDHAQPAQPRARPVRAAPLPAFPDATS